MKLFFVFLVASLLIINTAATTYAKKIIRVGVRVSDVGQLDPHRSSKTQDVLIVDSIFNGLVRFRPGNMNPEFIEPDLAKKWKASADGLTWTFYLRKGVQFHQGFGELTAEDVVFSLNKSKDSKKCKFWSSYKAFDKIEAIDRYTVKIVLSTHIPTVLGVLTDYHGGMIICKNAYQKYGKDFNLNPVGTGPFEFVEYTPQMHVKLKANEKYFRGKPKIDGITYRFMSNLKSRQLAFKKGELDVMQGQRENWWVEEVRKYPSVTVDIVPPGEMRTLHFNMTRKPLDNIKVRKALAYIINRQELMDYHGLEVTEPAVSPVPPHYLGHTDDVELYTYNPQKAKKLLADAGYPKGFDLGTMKLSASPVYQKPMTIIQEQLKKAGIRLNLETVDHPTYHKMIRKNLNPIVLYGAARFPIADPYLTQFYHSKSVVSTPTAVTNFSHYGQAIPGVDEYIEKARSAVDPKVQKKYWEKAQKKIMKDIPAYPLFVLKLVLAKKNYVKLGYKMHSTLSLFYQFNEKTDIKK